MRSILDLRCWIFASRAGRRLAAGFAAAVGVAMPVVARAQGCAMCYQSASAANQSGLEALQNGVLILLFPPLLIFAAILWLSFHRRVPQEAAEVDSRRASGPRKLTSPIED